MADRDTTCPITGRIVSLSADLPDQWLYPGSPGRLPLAHPLCYNESMLAHREHRRFTHAEYLVLEERAEVKSEYHRGVIYALTGGSMEHNQLVRNLTLEMGSALEQGSCQLFLADMRLYVAAHDLFTYPDLFVVCGPPPRMEGRRDTLTDATMVVEVLSFFYRAL